MRIGFERVFSHSFTAWDHIAEERQLKKTCNKSLELRQESLKSSYRDVCVFSLPARHKLFVFSHDWQLFKRFKCIKCSIFKNAAVNLNIMRHGIFAKGLMELTSV